MAGHQMFHREHMRRRQVVHMDEIADARAVARRIIRAKDVRLLAHAGRDFHQDGNEVERAFLQPGDAALHVVAGRIEVA